MNSAPRVQRIVALPSAAGAVEQIPRDMPGAVLAVVAPAPEECCRVGFDALPVPGTELPEEGFVSVGDVEGLRVFVEAAIVPEGACEIWLGFDRDSGLITALFQEGE